MTGFPMRTGFGRGYPEHDPWRFDATRLVESGEADCALWISAYRAAAPDWRRPLPMIALTGADADFRHAPRVHIDVGRPGARSRRRRVSRGSRGTRAGRRDEAGRNDLGRRRGQPHRRGAAVRRSMAMLTRIAGGRVIDPANGRDGIGDVWMRDGRIVDPPPSGTRADDSYDAAGKIVMAGAHRHPFPHRRRQREHGAAAAAGISSRGGRAAGAGAAGERRLGHVRDRLPLCRHGLHHRGRAGGGAAPRPARASRARRYPDHRQGDVVGARQRRLPAGPDARRRGRLRRSRLRRLDAGNVARARHQGGQCRRRRRLQGECARLFVRRRGAVLRRFLARHRQDAATRRA